MRSNGAGGYRVSGSSADDVVKVVQELERQKLSSRGPWRAGVFYILCLTAVCVVFLAVSRLAPIWLVPVVLVAALVGLLVLGSLQQRQDGRMSERGFLDLMQAALRTAGAIVPDRSVRPEAGQTARSDAAKPAEDDSADPN